MLECNMRTARLTFILLLVAGVIRAERSGIVAYYAGLKDAKRTNSTSCADNFGRVTVFRGAVHGKTVAHPETYSLCVESTESVEEMIAIFEHSGIDVGFGATLTN